MVLAALTTGLIGATTGIASADTTSPTSTDPGTTVTDPGAPTSTDPADPTGPTTTTDPITFSLPTATAHVRSGTSRSARARMRARHTRQVHSVVRVARAQHGKPYVYGGAGPRSFDCSGLVRYVFGHAVGRWLPHNAEAQYRSVRHIKRRNLQVGDLVFQESGGYAFHVGIYAGHGKWWHAPHTGARVHKQRIYSGHKFYGRVLTYRTAKHHKK